MYVFYISNSFTFERSFALSLRLDSWHIFTLQPQKKKLPKASLKELPLSRPLLSST